jgi:hypothetical protein
MLIRYTGSSVIRRTVGPYEWSQATQFVQDVPADMAADLLTSPENAFEVDGREPLLRAAPIPTTDDFMAGLAMAGVESARQLAAMDEDDLLHVALSAELDPTTIIAWASNAHDLFSVDEEE